MTAAAYRRVRESLGAAVRDLEDDLLDGVVPATPAWRVRDVIAHLAGVAEDVVAGRMEGAAGPEWTAAQVYRRQGQPIASVLAAWSDAGPLVEAMVEADAGLWLVPVDAWQHEQDVRGLLGLGPRVDGEAIGSALRMTRSVARRCEAVGLPGPRFVAGGEVVADGDGPTVEGPSRYDLARALFGRRTADEVSAWFPPDVDPAPYLPLLGAFPPPEESLPT